MSSERIVDIHKYCPAGICVSGIALPDAIKQQAGGPYLPSELNHMERAAEKFMERGDRWWLDLNHYIVPHVAEDKPAK
jgi:hypothetical protein